MTLDQPYMIKNCILLFHCYSVGERKKEGLRKGLALSQHDVELLLDCRSFKICFPLWSPFLRVSVLDVFVAIFWVYSEFRMM